MWTGDPREFILSVYKQYYKVLYVGKSEKSFEFYINTFNTLKKYIEDVDDSTIITTTSEVEKIDILPRTVGSRIWYLLDEAVHINLTRKNDENFQLTPVTAWLIITDNDDNIIFEDFGINYMDSEIKSNITKEYYEKYYSNHKFVLSVHAELDIFSKIKEKGLLNKDYKYYIFTVRNGGDTISRPCKLCRNFMKNEFGDYNITMIYIILGDFIGIEKLKV